MPKLDIKSQNLLYLIQVGLLAAVYFGAGKLGLSLASVEGIVTLVWPPTGIALAALLLFGYRLWPGVALGAFMVNVSAGAPLATAMGLSVGNTLEAVVGTYLLQQMGFRHSLERLRDVLNLVILAAVASTVVSATIGVANLGLAGIIPWTAYGSTWWVWWLGDALGVLLVAPVLLTWSTNFRIGLPPRRLLEAAALLGLLVVVSQIAFGGWLTPYLVSAPLSFTLFPFLVWAALRFGQRGAVTVTLIGTGIAVWGVAHGFGPFALESLRLSLALLGGFMSTTAVTAMLLAAAIAERRRAEEVLRESKRRYSTIFDKSPFALALTKMPERVTVGVNDAFLKLFEYTREEVIGRTSVDLGISDPDSQAQIAAELQAHGSVRDFECIRSPRSGARLVLSLNLDWVSIGREKHILTTIRDITKRKQTEAALRESQDRLAGVILSISDHIYMTEITEEGRFVNRYLSPHIETLTGYPHEKLMNDWHFWAFTVVHSDDRVRAATQATRLADGQNSELEYRLLRANGEVIWVRDSARVVPSGPSHKIIYGVVSDITARKQAEESLRKSEERYHSLFEDSPISLWEEDFSAVKRHLDLLRIEGITNFRQYFESHPEGVAECVALVKINDVNKAVLELHQADSKEQILEGLSRIFSPETYEVFKEELLALMEGKTEFECESVQYTLAGDKKNINLRLSIAPGYEDTWSKVLISINDITERKQAEEELHKYKEYLEELVKERTVELEEANEQLHHEVAEHERAEAALQAILTKTEALYRMGQAIALSKNLPDLLQTVVDSVVEALPANRATLITFDLKQQEVIHFIRSGPGSDQVVTVSFDELWQGLSGWVLRERQPALSPQGRPDERESPAVQQRRVETNCGAIMVGPLLYQGKILGTLTAINLPEERDFMPADVDLLLAMANQAAIIIEHKQAEEALQESEVRFRSIIQSASDGVILANNAGLVISWNEGAQTMFDYTPEEILGQSLTTLMPERYRAAHQRGLERLHLTGESHIIGQTIELSGLRKDGCEFPVELSLATWQARGSTFYSGILRDITERKQAEARQAELLQELENVNQDLSDFAYVVSHDLKAPLRGISSLASWLATDYADKLDEEGQEQLDLLVGRVKRMNALIDGILQYSRLGHSVEDKREVNLNDLLSEVIELIVPPHIEIKLEHDLPTVISEKTRLQQLFQNLLSNASKFMAKPQGEIRVGCIDKGDEWQFYVADNGPGIEAKHFAKIFQLFQTLTPRDEVESTGIGLALVKKIVELHGGEIWVESKVGEGSVFFFTLPKSAEG